MNTKEAQHTPGPWHVNAIAGTRIVGDETAHGWDKLHINSANHTVARVFHGPDARLIAAAPELLEACQRLVSDWEGNLTEAMADVRSAIASATGKE